MRKSRRPIIIASRRSRLARAQAEAVGRVLGRLNPHVDVSFRWIDSEGDRRPTVNLTAEGGKGMFTRAVERALLSGAADLAVHSLKDLPTVITPGLAIAAVPKRGDARDCLISATCDSIESLPQGAVVGTSSPRRRAQLLRLRPDLNVQPIRGNVDTRLSKVLDQRLAEATLLCCAGLQRAGLGKHANKPIDKDIMLPAASQAALAVQCRTDDHVTLSRCLPLNDPATASAVNLERMVIDGLDADCHSAVAVFAHPDADDQRRFHIRAQVYAVDGGRTIEAGGSGMGKELDGLARQIVADLRDQGADVLLRMAAPRQQQPI